jgi:hypothetical protein
MKESKNKTKGFGILYGSPAIDDEDEDDEDEIDCEDEEIEILPPEPQKPVKILGFEINATLFDMIIGAIIFGLLCQATVVWFVSDKSKYSLGLWLGIAVAIAYIIHLWWSINHYLHFGTAAAARVARRHTLLRYLAVAAVLLVTAITNFVHLLAVFLGIMGIKAAALLSLLVPKLLRRQHG